MVPLELPRSVTRLLWDTDPATVSWEGQREFLVGRVLAHGDWDALRWLRRTAGDVTLRNWIVATRGRRLTRAQLRFWQLLLDLPEPLVQGWLDLPERKVWDERCA